MRSHPDHDEIKRAIAAYLAVAYDGRPSAEAQTQQQTIDQWQGDVLACPAWVCVESTSPKRHQVRLGNAFYPHMKLSVEVAADGSHFFFRVDTHDRHCCPQSASPEYGAFCQLMERNQKVAESIESAWEKQGLPTFKSYLREDLKRRGAAIH